MTEVSVESLAYGGDGIAHLPDGRTVFVAAACPGDVARIRITEDRGRFVRATIQKLIAPSSERVDPPCPYFGVCGGCTWQHVSPSVQTISKRRAVVDALVRIGGVIDAEERVAPIESAGRDYGYRNKIELVAATEADGLVLGYHKAASDEIIPIESCLLLPPQASSAPKALLGALRYLSGSRDLGIHRIALRVAAHTDDVQIALWTVPDAFPRKQAETVLARALKTTSIVRVMSRNPDASRDIAGVEVLSGTGFWRERLGNHMMAVSAPSFFQVNTDAAELVTAIALNDLPAGESTTVIDAYAGVGTLTLPLADTGADVIAIESVGSAVQDLRRNLERAHLHAEVIGGDAAREMASIDTADALLVDPPRAGLKARAVASITGTGVRSLVYVSCDPATLARDANTLQAHGYEFVRATPVDMFPQTYHVETVAVFRRR